ncbi:MAG: hypothetical protein RQ826_15495 [Xanthomonadales bacterium]|nr:hypothetical protein [Xanthomonadales bacterium]
MSRSFLAIITLVGALLWAPAALSEDAEGYARMARQTLVAFECAHLADMTDKKAEHKRLFEYGLDQGRIAIEVIISGRADLVEFENRYPIDFFDRVKGPSADFALGRIYEAVGDDLYEELGHTMGGPVLRKATAENQFRDDNCDLIGR